MDLEMLKKFVPSAFAEHPATHVSENYRFFPTFRFIEAFMDSGWKIHEARQMNPTKKDPTTCKHQIDLRHPDFGFDKPDLGEVIPRISLINSHDWSSRMSVFIGLFRLVCTNGMMVSFGSFAGMNIRHDADVNFTVQDITERFTKESGDLIGTVTRWKTLELPYDRRMELATQAGRIRWGADKYTGDPSMLLLSRRPSDDGNDLWHTYNRLQENTFKGGIAFNGRRRARSLSNIDAMRTVNTELFEAAKQMELSLT